MDWEKYLIGFLVGVVVTSSLGVAVVHFSKPMTQSVNLASSELQKKTMQTPEKGTSAAIFADSKSESTGTQSPPPSPIANDGSNVPPTSSEVNRNSVETNQPGASEKGLRISLRVATQGNLQIILSARPGDVKSVTALWIKTEKKLAESSRFLFIDPENLQLVPGYYDYRVISSQGKSVGTGELSYQTGQASRKTWRRDNRKAAAMGALIEKEKLLGLLAELRKKNPRKPASSNQPRELRLVDHARHTLAYREQWKKTSDLVTKSRTFDHFEWKSQIDTITTEVKNRTFF